MKNLTNQKKAFLFLASYLIILFTPKRSKNKEATITYNDKYQIEELIPYATYNNKSVYIIDDGEKIDEANPNDICVVDHRESTNSTMIVYDSYRIKNKQEIETVLNILLNYEDEYPSNWNRTLTSMEKEWLIHNICYFLNYEQARTKHVDLDNEDEEDFSSIVNILSKIKEIIDIPETNENAKKYTLKK